jgi:hypothetical protein
MKNREDEIVNIEEFVRGKTEDEAEKALVKKYGSIPDVWFDPLQRAKLLEQDPAITVIEGHLNNFENSYGGEDSLGKSARGIGDLRNIAGQGMPGEEAWREQAKLKK